MDEMMVRSPRPIGRPYIGPKAQTHIWPWIHGYVKSESKARGVPRSDVWREMLEEAYALRTGGEA